MVQKIFTLCITCIIFNFLFGQDSCHFRISLLTCTPGRELYSTFGHSALRVTDSESNIDIIFNYGTFDFDDPNFYSKFTRGKLLYFVSVNRFDNFVQEYTYEQRGIMEQVIHLSCQDKEKLFDALRENAKEENKFYKYDFIHDNCTTRLRDIVFKNTTGTLQTKNIRPGQGVTFRNLIHEYLNKSYQCWSKLGIDILLGSPVDKKITNSEAMFLPDYLLKGFDSTSVDGEPLVSEKKEILKSTLPPDKSPLLSPFAIFAILFLMIALLSFVKNTNKFFAVFDFILFFFSGALGILILFMWLGTDHPECRNNFNLAWAFPFHIVSVFLIYRKRDWLRYYFFANAFLLFLLLIFWVWLPQEMNNAQVPIICILFLRSIVRYKKFGHGH